MGLGTPEERDTFKKQLETEGVDSVREKLQLSIYGHNTWRSKLAQGFVEEQDQKKEYDFKQHQMNTSSESVATAKEANKISKEANKISHRAFWISIFAACVSALTAFLAWYYHN